MEIRFNPAAAPPAVSVPEAERAQLRRRPEAEPSVETDRVDLQSREHGQRAREAEQTRETEGARALEDERRPEPPPQVAHYKFEYEGKRTILRLQDSKGALIYQVPPQGRLTLLLEEEKVAARLRDTA